VAIGLWRPRRAQPLPTSKAAGRRRVARLRRGSRVLASAVQPVWVL